MIWEQAQRYASELQLGGYSDWRLPNSLELFSIMNHGRSGPAMDTAYFPRTEARYWWTDTTRADDATRVWVVNTGGGIGAHPLSEAISAGGDRPMHVRCVRGDSPFATGPRLHDNGDGTVTDQQTSLTWQKLQSQEPMAWEDALGYCAELRLGDRKDWRLPNIKELRSISDDRRTQPSLDSAFFPHAHPAYYWSSTSQSNQPERAWFVDFSTGLVSYSEKSDRFLVFAVCGGEIKAGPQAKPLPDSKLWEQAAKKPSREKKR